MIIRTNIMNILERSWMLLFENSKFSLTELKFGAKSERISGVLSALLTLYAGSWDLHQKCSRESRELY